MSCILQKEHLSQNMKFLGITDIEISDNEIKQTFYFTLGIFG